MYSSNSNNLIISSYPKPFSFGSNQTSKDIETISPFPLTPPTPTPLSFFQFPYSPFEDNQIFIEHQHDFLLHHHQSPPAEPVVVNSSEPNSNSINTKINTPPPPGKPILEQQIPRKRTSKRDRHSKINTARGLRDRRMRLSLEVAKRFFGLQDMLGFDKASKTVEWLLNQAKAEIKQLAREKSTVGAKSASSTSECEEGVSSLDEVVVSGNQQQERETHKVVKRRNKKVSRKSAFNPIGREKARERARERTREKMKTRTLASVDESNSKQCNNKNGKNHNNNLSSSCWNPFESTVHVEEESAGTKHQSQSVVNPSFDVQLVEPSSRAKEHSGTVQEDNPLFNMMFSSLNNSGILQEHQFEQFESMEKPWEAYNNRI